jgi:GTP-binding protein
MSRIRKFVDTTTIIIKGGHGGNGCISFQKTSKFGPPNGGNGGRGGHVFITPSNVDCLGHLERVYKIESGKSGSGSAMKGEDGSDVVIPVPIGTFVTQVVGDGSSGAESTTSTEPTESTMNVSNQMVSELFFSNFITKSGYVPLHDRQRHWITQIPYRPKSRPIQFQVLEKMMLRKGGTGGFGNAHFTTPQITAPQVAGKGEFKKDTVLELTVKLKSDVAFVGFGSRNVVSLITNCKSIESVYEFQQTPMIGVIEFIDHLMLRTIALPFTTLQHLEQTKLIIGVVDLRRELELQLKQLLELKCDAIVVDGIEMKGAKDVLNQICELFQVPVIPISSKYEKNGGLLKEWIRSRLGFE